MTTLEALESTALILLRHNYAKGSNQPITPVMVEKAVTRCTTLFDHHVTVGDQMQASANLMRRLIPAGGR